MATRYAAASWVPLGPQIQPRMRAHDIVCFHTMVGSLAGTRAMFLRNGFKGTESHFGVGEKGETDQWQDIAYTADANLDGNGNVISIENADYGGVFGKWDTNNASLVPAFTQAQIDRLIDLGVALALPGKVGSRSMHSQCPKTWKCYNVGIPAALIPDTRSTRRGFGYHAQGVPGVGLVSGGVQWSSARGKVCPGARRIRQVKDIIIPGIAARLRGEGSAAMQVEITRAQAYEIGHQTWLYKNVKVTDKDAYGLLTGLVKSMAKVEATQAAILAAVQGIDAAGIQRAIDAAVADMKIVFVNDPSADDEPKQ